MKNKIIFLLAIIIFSIKPSYGQKDSLEYYVNKLNWNSFEEIIGFAPRIKLGPDIHNLIAFKDPQKINYLVNKLSDETKTVAIHIVLTNVYIKGYSSFGMIDEAGKWSVFEYNGLKWKRRNNVIRSISKKDIKRIKIYWKKRIEND